MKSPAFNAGQAKARGRKVYDMYSGLKRSIWCYTCDRKDNE